ncbi:Rrf2 family iron-responsive transcriptional regulator [Kaistia dalseonensis]|uniref:Rrf2 family iron-responsive transcriptional regulator n=1 Tax=Kaistia dalseonensis TaxID=410840 RepID=A0ABU0HFD7_9HYPH|nr:Rrf2 family iron-responsive transcriptional regulator [Kaistia dalseonensis]
MTQQTSYSIRVLLYCAANMKTNSRIRDIAATYNISELHLFKIMHVLVEAGFIETVRGRNGGIKLAKPANDITIGAVVRATESNFYLTDCFDTANRDCPLVDSCGVNGVLNEALRAFFAVLDSYTIADVATDRNQLRGLLDIGAEPIHPLAAAASFGPRLS